MTCPARLFDVDDSFMRGFILESNRIGLAFHPLDAVHFRPLQSPQPAQCVRQHADQWHYDGVSTWWNSA